MRKSRGDIPGAAFGGFLILLAIVALMETRNLSQGTAEDMGPGYVPRALAFIIMGFRARDRGAGLLRQVPAAAGGSSSGRSCAVLVSLAVFALLLPRGGLALATLATMACSTFATADYRWRESVIFAVIITAFTVLLFVYGLGLPLAVWPRW